MTMNCVSSLNHESSFYCKVAQVVARQQREMENLKRQHRVELQKLKSRSRRHTTLVKCHSTPSPACNPNILERRNQSPLQLPAETPVRRISSSGSAPSSPTKFEGPASPLFLPLWMQDKSAEMTHEVDPMIRQTRSG
jgi:hypothetical protein